MRRPARLAWLGLAATLALACGSPTPGTPTTSAHPTPTASLSTSAPTEAPSPLATPRQSSGTGSPGAVVALEPQLLDILPGEIDGVALEFDPEAFEDIRTDPDVAATVESIAFFVLARGDDIAVGVVARPRADPFGADAFRDWRDSYDEGACEFAGGVAGHASATLGGRTVHIATCEGGVRVYHVSIPERRSVVSLFSVGPANFGERLVEAIGG